MQDSLVLVMAVCIVSSLVILLFLVYLTYLALRGTIRLLAACGSLGSPDSLIRLSTLAVALWVFPQPISYLLDTIPEFLRRAIVDVPPLIAQGSERASTLCTPSGNTYECLRSVVATWFQLWAGATGRLFEAFRFDRLPVLNTVFLVAAWAVLARLVDRFLTAPDVSSKVRAAAGALVHSLRSATNSFVDSLRGLPGSAWQNTLLLLVLTAAGYLSIAAIVAIPYLQAQAAAPTDVSADKLRERLAKSMLSAEQYEMRYPVTLVGPDPFGEIKASPQSDETGIDPTQTFVRQVVVDQRKNREAAMKGWAELRNMAFDRQRDLLETAVNTYTVGNLARKGVREQVAHFMEIDDWFRRALDDQEGRLQKCRQSIAAVDAQLFVLYPQLVSIASVGKEVSVGMAPSVASINRGRLAEAWSETRGACEPVYQGGSIPARPELGAYLGAFGVVARWLVKTESLPLALITGLLGFGLLGAACSTFVRTGVRKSGKQPLIDDIPGVLIRGAAAAMVVFLAVYGGLAIYTSGSAEPNPYVVLFTCLVAAVFSETVWDWAHQRLRSELNIAGTTNSQSPSQAAQGRGEHES